MKHSHFFLLPILLFALAAHGEPPPPRPGPTELRSMIDGLGAESHTAREEAQKQLRALSERHPRYVLAALSERYKNEEDLEIELRLAELIEPLAMSLMFDLPSGFIGVNLAPVTLEPDGPALSMMHVYEGLSAHEAGLQNGDIILALDGKTIADLGGQEGFVGAISRLVPGTIVHLLVQRGAERFRQPVSLAPRPFQIPDRLQQHQEALRLTRAWLDGLRAKPGQDPGFPVGHFPLDDSP